MLCCRPDNLYRAREVSGVGGIVSHWVRAMCPSEIDVLMGPDPTLGRYLSDVMAIPESGPSMRHTLNA